MEENTKKHLPHVEAAEQIIKQMSAGEMKYGDLITHEFLELIFDEPPVLITQFKSTDSFRESDRRRERRYQDFVRELKDLLLEEHSLMIVSDPGKGYRVMEPSLQARFSIGSLKNGLKRNLKTCSKRLNHTRVDELSPEQSREHNDSLGRVAAITSFLTQKRFGGA